MASLIQEIVNQAQLTFSKRYTHKAFPGRLSKLIRLINGLKASDLNINLEAEQTESDAANAEKCSDPITSTFIAGNELFRMRMFVVKKGSKIPLHDHPEMHNIIKVILGTVKITTYSPTLSNLNRAEIPEEISRMSRPTDSLVPVVLHMSENVTNRDESVLATPTVGNYHEMLVVEGPAVIFDLIGPPYDMENPNIHYYTVLESKDSNFQSKIWLSEVREEFHMWFVEGEYTGPNISL